VTIAEHPEAHSLASPHGDGEVATLIDTCPTAYAGSTLVDGDEHVVARSIAYLLEIEVLFLPGVRPRTQELGDLVPRYTCFSAHPITPDISHSTSGSTVSWAATGSPLLAAEKPSRTSWTSSCDTNLEYSGSDAEWFVSGEQQLRVSPLQPHQSGNAGLDKQNRAGRQIMDTDAGRQC
jgi:hypothetical protein